MGEKIPLVIGSLKTHLTDAVKILVLTVDPLIFAPLNPLKNHS
jgi:hypothetical protein